MLCSSKKYRVPYNFVLHDVGPRQRLLLLSIGLHLVLRCEGLGHVLAHARADLPDIAEQTPMVEHGRDDLPRNVRFEVAISGRSVDFWEGVGRGSRAGKKIRKRETTRERERHSVNWGRVSRGEAISGRSMKSNNKSQTWHGK